MERIVDLSKSHTNPKHDGHVDGVPSIISPPAHIQSTSDRSRAPTENAGLCSRKPSRGSRLLAIVSASAKSCSERSGGRVHVHVSQSLSRSFFGKYSSEMKLTPFVRNPSTSILKPFSSVASISRCHFLSANHGYAFISFARTMSLSLSLISTAPVSLNFL